WLRTGIDPNGNGTEAQIASGLQRLTDDLHQAQQALVAGGQRPDAPSGGAEAALDNVERLRRQIEALSGRDGNQRNSGQGPGAENLGRENYQTGALTRNGRPGQQG